jgi:ribonucleoside-diphosphate reductase alpha chain
MQGPQLAFSDAMHGEKYRGPQETFRDYGYRVAAALKDDDDHFKHFSQLLLNQFFLPAGRIQAAVGALWEVTPYNCFVSGIIEDSMVDGNGSIMGRLAEAAATMRMGGGIGYDFSTLRPYKDLIRTQHTYASGPVSFMSIHNSLCKTIASAGHRRGAQMAVLRIDHPDIEMFINAKHPSPEQRVLWELVEQIKDPNVRLRAWKALQKTLPLTAFNMSIAVTDEFMECLAEGKPFPLRFDGRVYRHIDPCALWEMVMRSTWDWGEPGVLFIDTINRMNNLWYCEKIAATNPCAEQPLPPHGACLLGSMNLVKYVKTEGMRRIFDWDRFGKDIPCVVRAMDNVIDQAKYPTYEQKKEAQRKRRMGIGVTGMANCIEAMIPGGYGSPDFLRLENMILQRLTRECYLASIDLAREKGSFKLFDKDSYLSGAFIATLDDDVREGIARYGIRNSHLTSIAPTGTISLCADNVSSGLEPVFAYSFNREINTAEGVIHEDVEDYGLRVFGVRGKISEFVTVQEHLDVLCTAQTHIDSAVSKTCNVPGSVKWDEFKELYTEAWRRGAKGLTTFRIDGMRTGIFTVKGDDSLPSPTDLVATTMCHIDEVTGRKECD